MEPQELAGGSGSTAALGLVCSAVDGDALGAPHQHLPLTFLPFAVVVVMALRLDDRGAAVGVLVTALAAVLATVHGHGPFGAMDAQAGIWLLWPLIGFLAVAALLLGASSAERRQQRTRLERAYSRVDALVEERTAALRETQARLEAANQHLLELATQDGLTGIANRRSFDEQLARELSRARRNDTWLSVVLVDVDFFKDYNDSRGHQAGDRCLQTLAWALSKELRRGGDRVSRYGGEEFAILLPETPPTGAEKVAEKLRATIEDLGLEHGAAQARDRVTISLGVASLRPGHATSPERVLKHADDQLYRAKSEGRNQVCSVVLSPEHSDGPLREP